MSSHLEKVESALQNKDYHSMNALISSYLKSEKYSKGARLVSSEFYRRISEYSKGLELLQWQNKSLAWSKLDGQEIRIRLQSVRLLNLLGASAFALRVLDSITPEIQQKYYELIAPIYLSNDRPAEANRLYSFLSKLPSTELDYQRRLRLIGLADSYSALGKPEKAIQIAEKLFKMSAESSIIAILNEAIASYYLKSGDLRQCEVFHERAKTFFHSSETTVDYGYLLKWEGARLILQGRLDEAESSLDRAFGILYKKGLKPEVWLEVLYWKGLLTFKKNPKIIPKLWKILLCYPTSALWIQKEIAKHVSLPEQITVNHSKSVKRTIHIREEMIEGSELTLGLDLPQKMLSHLLIAEEYGVPFYRLCDVIWDDGLLSADLHFKRLAQGLIRLRREKIEVSWKEMHLSLNANSTSDRTEVQVSLQPKVSNNPFFDLVRKKPGGKFCREDVEEVLQLSRSAAAKLCKEWIEKKLVVSEKVGRLVFYLPLETTI